MKLALLLIASLLCVGPQAHANESTSDSLGSRFAKAYAAGDAETLSTLFYFVEDERGSPETKRVEATIRWQAQLSTHTLKRYSVETLTQDDNRRNAPRIMRERLINPSLPVSGKIVLHFAAIERAGGDYSVTKYFGERDGLLYFVTEHYSTP